jgi:hypothetical protein
VYGQWVVKRKWVSDGVEGGQGEEKMVRWIGNGGAGQGEGGIGIGWGKVGTVYGQGVVKLGWDWVGVGG